MSKWISEENFNLFKQQLNEEPAASAGFTSFKDKWPTPEKGTTEKPKSYELRLLPDKNKMFYRKMMYHMFKSGERWFFSLCPKTFDFEAYCPLCSVVSKLFAGNENDKKLARDMKRKEKFVVNVMVVDDPRDVERGDDEKLNGKVLLYEFPSQVEGIIREAINDTKNGVGMSAFDPGPDGYNFILKVGAKKGNDNKLWPEYTKSEFSRRQSPVAESDREIREVLESTLSIDEYLKSQVRSEDQVLDVLKAEMLYEIIEAEHNRRKSAGEPGAAPRQSAAPAAASSPREERAEPEVPSAPAEDFSSDIDQEILDQLKDI
jgi:hypothetical protein